MSLKELFKNQILILTSPDENHSFKITVENQKIANAVFVEFFNMSVEDLLRFYAITKQTRYSNRYSEISFVPMKISDKLFAIFDRDLLYIVDETFSKYSIDDIQKFIDDIRRFFAIKNENKLDKLTQDIENCTYKLKMIDSEIFEIEKQLREKESKTEELKAITTREEKKETMQQQRELELKTILEQKESKNNDSVEDFNVVTVNNKIKDHKYKYSKKPESYEEYRLGYLLDQKQLLKRSLQQLEKQFAELNTLSKLDENIIISYPLMQREFLLIFLKNIFAKYSLY